MEMSDQESSSSASQTEGEVEEEVEEDVDTEGEGSERRSSPAPSLSSFSSSLRAVIRIKQKYQAMKKRRQELALQGLGGDGPLTGAPVKTSPKIFTFDGLTPYALSTLTAAAATSQRKKRRRRKRVLFPNRGGCRAPPRQEQSRAKYCLYLLLAIVFMQVYNAIENLDDHVLRYDLDGLEKTLRREVFGQAGAVEQLLLHLRDYLSTYVHNQPLVLSLHGPSGVGKSHLGRLVAGHFRSLVGESLVLQYYVLHHCPLEADAHRCAAELSGLVSAAVRRAEDEEKIPLFVFDEAEHMHGEILDALLRLVASERDNEYLNAVYLFLSNLGHAHITKHMLHNASATAAGAAAAAGASAASGLLVRELAPVLRGSLEKLHPLWAEAALLPLGLLDKGHVMQCFLDEMSREGFYPDRANVERMAAELEYYPDVGGRSFSTTGCKQVVAKVNLL